MTLNVGKRLKIDDLARSADIERRDLQAVHRNQWRESTRQLVSDLLVGQELGLAGYAEMVPRYTKRLSDLGG
jgi:hypothetical protein